MRRGKVVPGVYINDSGQKKVMTKKEFKVKLRLRGGGNGGSKVTRWRKYRTPTTPAK